MNGSWHFRQAERLASLSDQAFRRSRVDPDIHADGMKEAFWFQDQGRLHAELAIAGATAAAFGIAWEAEQREEAAQWSRALGPLVTCGSRPDEDSTESCQLAAGHDGSHEHTGPGGLICWSDAPPESEPEPGPVHCRCGHLETHHAGRLEDTEPRGVCLTSCGCLQYHPATETARSTS